MLLTVLSLTFPLVMIWAMVADFRTFEIPHSLPIALVVVFPIAAWAANMSWQQIAWACGLATFMLVVAILMVLFRVMGGGDGKLIAAAALWTGPEAIMPFLLLIALMGGVLALVILLYRRLPLASTLASLTAFQKMHAEKRDLPYAIAIGIAGLIIYPRLPILVG
ncbi:MAG: prepilin peptidase [Alphaproteobacteria bacterium]|jgi:prepilin peptidase CpaA|nr:prepilin peptidase [Alphaproteobacteria bacterium]